MKSGGGDTLIAPMVVGPRNQPIVDFLNRAGFQSDGASMTLIYTLPLGRDTPTPGLVLVKDEINLDKAAPKSARLDGLEQTKSPRDSAGLTILQWPVGKLVSVRQWRLRSEGGCDSDGNSDCVTVLPTNRIECGNLTMAVATGTADTPSTSPCGRCRAPARLQG